MCALRVAAGEIMCDGHVFAFACEYHSVLVCRMVYKAHEGPEANPLTPGCVQRAPFERCMFSTVPLQCPYSALTVPLCILHSALTL